MEKTKQYVVIGIWYGVEGNSYEEWYSGIIHETRSDARRELINAQFDHNYASYRIEEV